MKATLVKKQANWYNLYQNDIGIGSTHAELQGYKLSLKNCQAVERGYDLDELAKIEYPICEVWNDEEALIRELAFKKGFQKALELMGDKKYSENDLLQAVEMYYGECKTFIEVIQSLQHVEWDVEVVMEPCYYDDSLDGFSTSYKEGMPTDQPKLDENGWLILKRI